MLNTKKKIQTIHYSKSNIYLKIYLYTAFFFVASFIHAQNIFDEAHSIQYADYLYKNEIYIEAAKEYERLLNFSPKDSLYSVKLLLSYLNSEKFSVGINKTKELKHKNKISDNRSITDLYTCLVLKENSKNEILPYLMEFQNLKNSDCQMKKFELIELILKNDFNSAETQIQKKEFINEEDSVFFLKLDELIADAQQTEFKKPFVAALLSVLIPGSGKAYADDFNNGANSFVIISLYGLQALRAFTITGGFTIYGLLFGTAAIIFYAGNIYGSYQLAIQYNKKEEKLIREKLVEILLPESEF
jgi:hypothetical protein